MGEREENDLIAEASKARAEARRKLKLLSDHLHNLGDRLKQIGNDLSPHDGREPNWDVVDSNLAMTHLNRDAAGFLDIDKIRALIGERLQLARTVEEKSDTLRKYGAE
jgi:hypothetical protein